MWQTMGYITEHVIVGPLYNGQGGVGAFVRYLEVSFIGRFHHGVAAAYR